MEAEQFAVVTAGILHTAVALMFVKHSMGP